MTASLANDKDDLYYFTDFTLYKPKDNGINRGGFYTDTANEKWLIKSCDFMQEYVAGGLYQVLLNERAPQTEIIIDYANHDLLIGSKLLPNFSTLHSLREEYYNRPSESYSDYPTSNFYGDTFPSTYNGKPIVGFFDAIAAVHFLKDSDAHGGNVGLMDMGSYYGFAKIDHGCSLNFWGEPVNLDSFRSHLDCFYGFRDLTKVGFDAVYEGITNITNKDFCVFEKEVCDRIEIIEKNLQEVPGFAQQDCYYHVENPTVFKKTVIEGLKENYNQYHKIADFMLLEKGILDHNPKLVHDALVHGADFEAPFKPFFNPIFTTDSWGIESQSVSGHSLATQFWPELLESKTQHQLGLSDVFMSMDIDFASAPALTPCISTPMLYQPMVEHFQAEQHILI